MDFCKFKDLSQSQINSEQDSFQISSKRINKLNGNNYQSKDKNNSASGCLQIYQSEEVSQSVEKFDQKVEEKEEQKFDEKSQKVDQMNYQFDEKNLNKQNQKQIEKSKNISEQINKTLNYLSDGSQQYKIYSSVLEQIVKYCPSPQNLDQSTDSKHKDFITSIDDLKQIIKIFIQWPNKFNLLQNKLYGEILQFQRNKSEITQRIQQHFGITYILKKEDLGQLDHENNINIGNLQKLKQLWDSERDYIAGQNIQSVIFQIVDYYKVVFGLNENKDSQSQLDQLYTEYNSHKMECQNIINDEYRKFDDLKSIINKNRSNLAFSQQKIDFLDQSIAQLIKNKDQDNNDIKRSFQNLKANKENELSEVKHQIKILNKKKEQLLEKSLKEQEKQQRQFIEKSYSLDDNIKRNLQIFGGGSLSSKSCFHYYYVVDESGSFSGIPHEKGIESITQSVSNHSPEDFVTVIKFDSNATVKFPKTQKSCIDINQFRNSINQCASGGTSFMNAFIKLKEEIQNSLSSQEYPIVIFITDGQDGADLASIINSIIYICNELIFFTVGYGKINQKQLHTITDMFNRCSGQQKNINGKQIRLFYQNSTPQQLYSDILKISTDNKVSIEDIKKAKEFFEESVKSQQEQISNFYNYQEMQIDKQMQILIQNEKILQNPITQESANQFVKSSLNHYDNYLQDLLEKRRQEDENQKLYKSNMETEILKQKIGISPSILEDFNNENFLNNFYKIGLDKIQKVEEEQNQKLKEKQIKLDNAKKEMEQDLKQKKDVILKSGFSNEEHFFKFYDVCQKFKDVQTFYTDITGREIDIIDQLIAVSNQIQKCIDFSSKNIEAMNRSDQSDRIICYFQKFDASINPQQKDEVKYKILLITNSSIHQNAKEQGLNKFYEEVIRKIDLRDLISYVTQNKSKSDLEKCTDKEVQKIIVHSGEQKLKNKKSDLSKKKQKQDDILEEKIEKLNNETNDERKSKIEEEIRFLKQISDQLQEQIEQIDNEIQENNYQLQEESYDKIQIIKQIVDAFVKAIQDALLKWKIFVSKLPFKQLIDTCEISNNALNCYKQLSIKRN